MTGASPRRNPAQAWFPSQVGVAATENPRQGFFFPVLDGGTKFSPKFFRRCTAIQFKVVSEVFAILDVKTNCKLKIVKKKKLKQEQSEDRIADKNSAEEKWYVF